MKFNYVAASLPPEFATEVCDVLLKHPIDRPYHVLREQLTQRTTASEQCKFQLLFTAGELGDHKPTQLFCKTCVNDLLVASSTPEEHT